MIAAQRINARKKAQPAILGQKFKKAENDLVELAPLGKALSNKHLPSFFFTLLVTLLLYSRQTPPPPVCSEKRVERQAAKQQIGGLDAWTAMFFAEDDK